MHSTVRSSSALGRSLRGARRGKGLTQAQLAERAGIGQPTVSNVERNAGNVSLDTLLRILAALGLELGLHERASQGAAAPWGEGE